MMASLYQRGSVALPCRFAIAILPCELSSAARFVSECHDAKRRKCHVQRERPSVNWKRSRMQTTKVSLTATAIHRRVAIDDFFPKPAPRDSGPVIQPWHGGKVAHN